MLGRCDDEWWSLVGDALPSLGVVVKDLSCDPRTWIRRSMFRYHELGRMFAR